MWPNIRSEFSFRKVYGPLARLVEIARPNGWIGIADYANTFAHAPLRKACAQANIKPLYGVTISVVEDITARERREGSWPVTLIARNTKGLQAIYRVVAQAYDPDTNFYYHPRIPTELVDTLSRRDIHVIGQGSRLKRASWAPVGPGVYSLDKGKPLAVIDNSFPAESDRGTYELLTGRESETKTTPQHILSPNEWLQATRAFSPHVQAQALENLYTLAKSVSADIATAPMVRFDGDKRSLNRLCMAGAKKRGMALTGKYKARLDHELALIKEKDFTDYFLIVGDLVRWAKKRMLVGPARGSSAGSLVCYLLEITEVDPLEHDLLFERFVDVNRADLPDIDIDFPDKRRALVLRHLESRYGADNVARIGTVNRMMAKSALNQFAQGLGIPLHDIKAAKDAIPDLTTGDARYGNAMRDALTNTDAGQALLERHPKLAMVFDVEQHASHAGKHAAGMVVANAPITDYCGVDTRDRVAMVDKYDAEALGLLKIDALGLRTLSILENCLDDIGRTFEWMYDLYLNDKQTFKMFNAQRLAGIFQFEGYALKSLTRQVTIDSFDDIVAITALARPGPLHSGGASQWIKLRAGETSPTYLHDALKPMTEETYGIVVFQEQVMRIVRDIGDFSWEDTSMIRKAMSATKGEDYFNRFAREFEKGAARHDIDAELASEIWKQIMTFGSWAFNKSHAVSYGLLSYWCAYLKTHHPLEYTCAYMNNLSDDDSGIALLRDVTSNDGIKFIPLDPMRSMIEWTIQDEQLVGALKNIRGVGQVKAGKIERAREGKEQLTPSLIKALNDGKTPFDILWPAREYFGDWYKNPARNGIVSGHLKHIEDIDGVGSYIFLGKLRVRSLRDRNEYASVVQRDGVRETEHTLWLNLTLEDDTDSIIAILSRFNYVQLGGPIIAETGREGIDWYLVKGKVTDESWRVVFVDRIKKITPGEL